MSIDNRTKVRRLSGLAKAVLAMDIGAGAKELRAGLAELQKLAVLAMEDTRRGSPAIALARTAAIEARKRRAAENAKRIQPIIKQLRAEGFKTYRALAAELNRRGIRPPVAPQWGPRSVYAIENKKKP